MFDRIIGAVTLVLYFIAHLMDPGYIPHDAVFFTEQEEPSHFSPSTSKYIKKRIDFICSESLIVSLGQKRGLTYNHMIILRLP